MPAFTIEKKKAVARLFCNSFFFIIFVIHRAGSAQYMVKRFNFLIYFHIAPGNFSLLAQRKVAEKESALVRALLRDFYFKKIVFYL
ncbi:hypothetical protein [Megamonas hypermegale]|uniref:hypothetical protein n=1 Tax=Megamonas hypermegale TaxID=158847 RepID=UPI0026EB6769|nr:hypothetical protein [Megamonas hypermegale]